MTITRLMTIAANAYSQESGGLCELPNLKKARRHYSGDSLADFIVIELHEVLEGVPPTQACDVAIKALENAKRQLGAIIYALTFATDDTPIRND